MVSVAESVCVLGVFDGVHEGHSHLIRSAADEAAASGLPLTILTFDKDPEELFLPTDRVRKILSNEDRLQLLSSFGAQQVIPLPFTAGFADLSPRAFLDYLVEEGLDMVSLHVGCDFRFGARASGDVEDIRSWMGGRGGRVVAHQLLQMDGAPVTATRIRDLLGQGQVEQAAALLGRPHYIRARVARGRGVGRSIGFPTANLVPLVPYAPLSDGVYGGTVRVAGQEYLAAVSVGVPSTFLEDARTTEAYILDFDQDIYDEEVVCSFQRWIRPMQTFEGVDDLVKAISDNVQWVRSNL